MPPDELPPFDLRGDGFRMLRCIPLADLGAEGLAVYGRMTDAHVDGDEGTAGTELWRLFRYALPDSQPEDRAWLQGHPERVPAFMECLQAKAPMPPKAFPPSSTDPTRRSKHWT